MDNFSFLVKRKAKRDWMSSTIAALKMGHFRAECHMLYFAILPALPAWSLCNVREAADTGAAPGHANSIPHLPGSPVANNSCPLRPYHTEYNHIVQLEMGNLIQITEEGTKTFSSTQCCLFFFKRERGGKAHISQTYSGCGFKTRLGKKREIKIAFHASQSSSNNKKPPSPSRAAPISAPAFLHQNQSSP